MVDAPASEGRPPRWLIVAGSAVIVFHLSAVLCADLAQTSGPWPTSEGPSQAIPPEFARAFNDTIGSAYLKPIRLAHHFRFASNRPGGPGVVFEARLKDSSGKLIVSQRFPEANANSWVQRRQALLAQALSDDQPVQPLAGESVAAPRQQLRSQRIWEDTEPRTQVIRTVPEHLVPRDRPVYQPSEWSLLLARSFARHLCRKHGAASAEIVRRSRGAPPPPLSANEEPPASAFEELAAIFGDLPRE